MNQGTKQMVKVRMAPSPTGNLHLGSAYSTLFNYLFAKRNKGIFILRIEDTDQSRSKKEFEGNIVDGLQWLGLQWDEGPYYQMQRLDQYKKAADRLLASGTAYYCFCTAEELEQERKEQSVKKLPPVYSGKCRSLPQDEVKRNQKEGKSAVIRFKMPEDRGNIVFNDVIHGEVSFNSSLLGDMVIMRGNGIPLYNFAVVVDDIDMKITHVLRGEDHLSNTPKQVVLFESLQADLPQFAHWPNILNPDRIGKLSKRENATAVTDYRKEGYLPEAIVNYLALLGWSMPEDREIMSLKEMEDTFDLSKMRKSPAAFDIKKLEWMNGEYIRMMSNEQLEQKLHEYLVDHPAKDKIRPLIPLVKERMKKLSDFILLTNFLFQEPEYDQQVFATVLKSKQGNRNQYLDEIANTMESLPQPWSSEEFEKRFRELGDKLELSATEMFQLIRVAVAGQTVTPPLFECLQILGEEKTIQRIRSVKEHIDKYTATM